MPDSRRLRVLDAAEDFAAVTLQAAQYVRAHLAPGVRGQLVRAAASVAANIAEASGLGTDKNFKRQLRLALASANECGSHLRILKRTGAIDPLTLNRCEAKRVTVCKMLMSLIRRLEEDEARDTDQQWGRRKRYDGD
jgi:four helix bundle protein